MAAAVSSLDDKTKKFHHAILETIETEKTYLTKLQTFIEVFINRLKNLDILNENQIHLQFDCWEITSKLHQDFYQNMMNEQQQLNNEENKFIKIGSIFLRSMKLFQLYKNYLLNYDIALNQRQQMLINHHHSQHDTDYIHLVQMVKSEFRIDIEAYFLEPIQRVPRYIMLLEQLIKYIPTDDTEYHEEREALMLAHAKLSKIANENNEVIKRRDNWVRIIQMMLMIEPSYRANMLLMNHISSSLSSPSSSSSLSATPRTLIRSGCLQKLSTTGLKHYMVWLFSDKILYGRQQQQQSSSSSSPSSSPLSPYSVSKQQQSLYVLSPEILLSQCRIKPSAKIMTLAAATTAATGDGGSSSHTTNNQRNGSSSSSSSSSNINSSSSCEEVEDGAGGYACDSDLCTITIEAAAVSGELVFWAKNLEEKLAWAADIEHAILTHRHHCHNNNSSNNNDNNNTNSDPLDTSSSSSSSSSSLSSSSSSSSSADNGWSPDVTAQPQFTSPRLKRQLQQQQKQQQQQQKQDAIKNNITMGKKSMNSNSNSISNNCSSNRNTTNNSNNTCDICHVCIDTNDRKSCSNSYSSSSSSSSSKGTSSSSKSNSMVITSRLSLSSIRSSLSSIGITAANPYSSNTNNRSSISTVDGGNSSSSNNNNNSSNSNGRNSSSSSSSSNNSSSNSSSNNSSSSSSSSSNNNNNSSNSNGRNSSSNRGSETSSSSSSSSSSSANSKHMCYNCGATVCSDCSTHSFYIPFLDPDRESPVCNPCHHSLSVGTSSVGNLYELIS